MARRDPVRVGVIFLATIAGAAAKAAKKLELAKSGEILLSPKSIRTYFSPRYNLHFETNVAFNLNFKTRGVSFG